LASRKLNPRKQQQGLCGVGRPPSTRRLLGLGQYTAMCKHRETMQMRMIVVNVVYSVLLFLAILFTAIGVSTFQWIEADANDMVTKGGVKIPANVPGLNKVSCGLLTYCIDAAGEVAECTLPWARYGSGKGVNGDSDGEAADHPIALFNVSAAFISFGLVLMAMPWLYSLVICFGLFHTSWQRCGAAMVTAAGWSMVIGLLCFGAAFDQLAVNECADGTLPNADGTCDWYQPVFPSVRIEGSVGAIGCRICAANMDKFTMSDSCVLGWGGYFVLAAFIMTLFASCLGYAIKARPGRVENAQIRAHKKQAQARKEAQARVKAGLPPPVN